MSNQPVNPEPHPIAHSIQVDNGWGKATFWQSERFMRELLAELGAIPEPRPPAIQRLGKSVQAALQSLSAIDGRNTPWKG